MTITLHLQPEELAALDAHAQAQNTDRETVLRRVIAQMPTPPAPLSEKDKAALVLLDAWAAEDAAMTSEEREQSDRDFEEFKTNINRWRAEEGRPPAFR